MTIAPLDTFADHRTSEYKVWMANSLPGGLYTCLQPACLANKAVLISKEILEMERAV